MSKVTDWTKYAPYFTRKEFQCKHTGFCEMDVEFMDWLLALRIAYGKAIRVGSGYRHPTHPVEAAKGHGNGEHTQGRCIDTPVSPENAFELMKLAINMGATRIGVSQKSGAARFLHIGLGGPGLPTPRIWSY